MLCRKRREPLRGAVLVVDEAVGMAGVGVGDQPSGGVQVFVAPGAQFKVGRQTRAGACSTRPRAAAP